MRKPRIRFCWLCSRKLRGNHYVEAVVDGHLKIMHKACAKYAEEEEAKDIMQANHRSPFGPFA